MVLDIELTLNRFGFRREAKNKIQVAFIRLALWRKLKKHAISFEINWKPRQVIGKK